MENHAKEKEEDWWDKLPPNVKAGINESIEQADRGEFISMADVKKEVSNLLKQEIKELLDKRQNL